MSLALLADLLSHTSYVVGGVALVGGFGVLAAATTTAATLGGIGLIAGGGLGIWGGGALLKTVDINSILKDTTDQIQKFLPSNNSSSINGPSNSPNQTNQCPRG